MLTRRRVPKGLAKVHTAVDDLESQRLVCKLRVLVVNLGIRGQLPAALLATPFFGSEHEISAHTAPPKFFADEPTLHKPDRAACIATVGVRAKSHFQKAGQCPVCVIRNDNYCGKCPA